MIKEIQKYFLYFLLLIVLQLLIFNNIELSTFINPYIYILFIILIPFETPKSLLLLLAFILGKVIDLFSGTPGVHSSAAIFTAFIRPYTLTLFAPREGYQNGTYPRIDYYGLEWFLKYSAVLVIAHHLSLFYLEAFSFDQFFNTFFRAVLSILFTLPLIILSQYFIFRR